MVKNIVAMLKNKYKYIFTLNKLVLRDTRKHTPLQVTDDGDDDTPLKYVYLSYKLLLTLHATLLKMKIVVGSFTKRKLEHNCEKSKKCATTGTGITIIGIW